MFVALIRVGGRVVTALAIAVWPAAAYSQDACGCPDGRRFAIGAAMFGKGSSRVVITGLRHGLPPVPGSAVPQCSDIQAVGQVVHLLNSADGRPFLKRESLKRGVIRDVCRTRIHFIEARKSYDFFADDGSAVTLGTDGETAAEPSNVTSDPADLSEDLTGQDLLRLGGVSQGANPGDSAFDQEDLKESAYFVVRKRIKVPLSRDKVGSASASDVAVSAGTLGRIEKRAGNRPDPLWSVELLPDSAPLPFWRCPACAFRQKSTVSNHVVVASSQIAEINHFFDQFGVEVTRFGNGTMPKQESQGTMELPRIYAQPKLSIDENVAAAWDSAAVESIQNALLQILLIPKKPRTGMLMLNEAGESAQADLLQRQCFIALDAAGGMQPLAASNADVKVFRPPKSTQVPPDYYAIDLEISLRSELGSSPARIVCRFPLDPIGIGLVDRARRILSNSFVVRSRP